MRGVETSVYRLWNYINGSGQLSDMQQITSKTMRLADDEEQSKPSYPVRLKHVALFIAHRQIHAVVVIVLLVVPVVVLVAVPVVVIVVVVDFVVVVDVMKKCSQSAINILQVRQ